MRLLATHRKPKKQYARPSRMHAFQIEDLKSEYIDCFPKKVVVVLYS